MTHKITVTEVLDALQTEVVIASSSEAGKSTRKLTFDVATRTYELWIAGNHVWSGAQANAAAREYNEFDAGLVDYTVENLAYAGI